MSQGYERTFDASPVYENGTQIKFSAEQSWWFRGAEETDIFTIERRGSAVYYLRNGKIFHKSAQAASGSYVVDSSFISTGTAIGDVTISTGDSGVTRHVYDVSGQRVLRVEPDGSKTVYLGSTELRWARGSTAVQAARSYPGGTRREFDGSVTYVVSGHQGSVTAAVDATTGAINHTRYLPYGGLRGGSTVDDKGFLGQTHDDGAGLVYLNNRHHDPVLGLFVTQRQSHPSRRGAHR